MSQTGEPLFLDECVLSWVFHLQPVQLGSETALVQRLSELHLDPRQEVPPHWTGNRLPHHHDGSTEVHLTTSDITYYKDITIRKTWGGVPSVG